MVEAEAIAASFVDARRRAAGLSNYPGSPPATLDEAYRIQAHAIGLMDDRVVGWKVGRIPPPHDSVHGSNRLAGPIFARTVVQASDEAAAMPVFAEGFAAAEAEFLLRLARKPDPEKRRYSMEEAAALVDAVHVGIEIASSPFPGINAGGPTVTVSDFGNNYGLIVGAAIANWQDAGINDWPICLLIDGNVAGAATAAAMLDGPVGAVRFLLELAAERGLPLEAGQWVSSGAVTGVHPVSVGASVEARFGDDLRLRCTIVEAAPAVG